MIAVFENWHDGGYRERVPPYVIVQCEAGGRKKIIEQKGVTLLNKGDLADLSRRAMECFHRMNAGHWHIAISSCVARKRAYLA